MKTTHSNNLLLISAFVFIVLFSYTAINKLYQYADFSEFLTGLAYLSPVAKPLAILIPAAEIEISALLLIPKTRIKGIYASLFLMLLFTTYLIYMKLTVSDLPCHCGGAIALLTWSQHILLNTALIALAGVTILLQQRNQKQIPKNKDTSPSSQGPERYLRA